MAAGSLIERRDADQAMHAGLGGEQTEGVLPGDGERDALESRFFARLVVNQLPFEAAPLGPAQVHPQQHFSPVLGLGAPGAWMNGDDGVLAIVLAAEHLLDLAGLHFLVEQIERGCQLGVNRLAGFGPLDQHREIVALPSQRLHQIAILLESPAALQRLLRFGLVLPEIGRGRARFQTIQLFFRVVGFKDSSGDRQHVG